MKHRFTTVALLGWLLSCPITRAQTAAQNLPEGFVLYEGLKNQFTIAIPKEWTVYDQSQKLTQESKRVGAGFFNLVVFYLPPRPGSKDSMTTEMVGRMDTGEIPSFFVQRMPAREGMSCGGFSPIAEAWVLETVSLPKGSTILEAAHLDRTPIAGCNGIRIREIGQQPGKDPVWASEVYAVSDGKTLYLFTLRQLVDNHKKNVEVFRKAVSTAKLAAAGQLPSGGASATSGVREPIAPNPAAEVPGTRVGRSRQLQRDITRRLFEEASKFHKDCEHTVSKAEPYGETEPSAIVAGMGNQGVDLEKRLRPKGLMVLEKWFVKSCEIEDSYEVLLVPSGSGANILIKRLGPATPQNSPQGQQTNLQGRIENGRYWAPNGKVVFAVPNLQTEHRVGDYYNIAADRGLFEGIDTIGLQGVYYDGLATMRISPPSNAEELHSALNQGMRTFAMPAIFLSASPRAEIVHQEFIVEDGKEVLLAIVRLPEASGAFNVNTKKKYDAYPAVLVLVDGGYLIVLRIQSNLTDAQIHSGHADPRDPSTGLGALRKLKSGLEVRQ